MLEPTIVPRRRLPRYGFHTHIEKLNGVGERHIANESTTVGVIKIAWRNRTV